MPGPRASVAARIRAGIVGRIGDLPTADIDSLSGKHVPSTTAQWTSLGITAPTDIWLCQESGGNLTSSAGTVLTASATPLYQQSQAGWTRKGVGFNATSNQRFDNTSYNNVASSSILVLMYMRLTSAPAGTQNVLVAGTSASNVGVAALSSAKLRYRNSGTIVDSSNTYTSAVVPVVFKHDLGNSEARLFTESEKLSPAFGGASGTTLALGASTPALFICLYFAVWKGTAAEQPDATIRAMLQKLRWNPTWS